MWGRRAGLALGCALVMGLVGAAQAPAFIYRVRDAGGTSIDRFNQDGTGARLGFISGPIKPVAAGGYW